MTAIFEPLFIKLKSLAVLSFKSVAQPKLIDHCLIQKA